MVLNSQNAIKQKTPTIGRGFSFLTFCSYFNSLGINETESFFSSRNTIMFTVSYFVTRICPSFLLLPCPGTSRTDVSIPP